MAKKPAYILAMLETISANMLMPEILSYGTVALVFFGLGRISGRRNPRAVAYGITADVPVEQVDPDKRAWILDKIKLGRPGEIEDIMGAVVYLASDASALVTGTALMIDGGWTAD